MDKLWAFKSQLDIQLRHTGLGGLMECPSCGSGRSACGHATPELFVVCVLEWPGCYDYATPMNMHQSTIRQRIISFGMIALIVVGYLAGKFALTRVSILGMCLWAVVFVLGGPFAVIQPVRLLHFIGNPLNKPLSRTAQTVIRCIGFLAFLVGAIMAINLAVNFSAYWNGLY